MLNKEVVTNFLNRKLQSYDWLKAFSSEELDAAIAEIPGNVNLGNCWTHQRACYLLLETLKRFMLFLDMGGGKTRCALELIKYRKRVDATKNSRAIVFVPYITSIDTWITETEKHTPELRCVALCGSTSENRAALVQADGDLFVICYQSAVALLAEKTQVKGKNKWNIEASKVRETFGGFNILIMDEIHRCKNIGSLTYRMCRAISAKCEYAIGLTGTPFGRDLMDLWAQFYLIDFGATLGNTLGFYRAVFFNQTNNYWGGFEYKFKQKLFDKLQQVIKNISIRYSVDEFHDMPPREYIPRKISTHSGIKSYADKAMAVIKGIQIQKSAGNYRALESEYLKLRQLSSGFMTLHGDDSNKLHVKFDENPKLDALQELVEDMPYGCKMVVFHHFVYTNELISERLKQMKVKHARIYGGSRDPLGQLQQFKTVDACTVLVINSRSGSSALNLQHANYCVFFEQPDSAIDRQQAERRIWRPGQDKRCWIYDFLMDGTADWPMHKANKVGENLLKNLLDGKVTL
jgi:SNF2 family DNA or RNA helicase